MIRRMLSSRDSMGRLLEIFPYVVAAHNRLPAAKLLGAAAHLRSGGGVGYISDFVVDRRGNVTEIILEIEEKLGLGSKEVAIAGKDIQIATPSPGQVVVVIGVDEDAIRARPVWRRPPG